jgi:hypothetical protein
MMVLTAKFGCARLYSRIMCADMDSRRLNLQACYAEYQWIIAYAEKFDVQIFQEELALCREMVRARACCVLPLRAAAAFACRPPVFSPANRRRSFPRKLLLFRRTAACTLPPAADVGLPLQDKPSLAEVLSICHGAPALHRSRMQIVASDFAPIIQLLMSRGRRVEQQRLPHSRIAERTGAVPGCARVLVRRVVAESESPRAAPLLVRSSLHLQRRVNSSFKARRRSHPLPRANCCAGTTAARC